MHSPYGYNNNGLTYVPSGNASGTQSIYNGNWSPYADAQRQADIRRRGWSPEDFYARGRRSPSLRSSGLGMSPAMGTNQANNISAGSQTQATTQSATPNPATTNPAINYNAPTQGGYNLGNVQYNPNYDANYGRYATDPFSGPAMDTTGWDYRSSSWSMGGRGNPYGFSGPSLNPADLSSMWDAVARGYGNSMPPNRYQSQIDQVVTQSITSGAPQNAMTQANTEYWTGSPVELRDSIGVGAAPPQAGVPAPTATTATTTEANTRNRQRNNQRQTFQQNPGSRGNFQLQSMNPFEALKRYNDGDKAIVEHFQKWQNDPNYRALYQGVPGVNPNSTAGMAGFNAKPARESRKEKRGDAAADAASLMLEANLATKPPSQQTRSDRKKRK